jgi:hypothetical protein
MAISFAGGTDNIAYGGSGWNHTLGAISFWLKTTQTTTNAVPLSAWTASSRTGFGFILNNTAGKLLVQGYDGTTPRISMTGTATINDGNWHNILFNWNTASGAASTCYVDGVQDSTQNAGAAWGIASFGTPLTLGDNNDTFWPSYVGAIAEIGVWFDRNLTTDEVNSLAKGFSPRLIYPTVIPTASGQNFYMPLVRSPQNLVDGFITAPTGTTVTDHPRILGL